MEVAGQSPYIARALGEAQQKGIPTAAIVGSASLASARFADTVLAAQAHPTIGVRIVSVEAIVHALAQVLRWRFADRFAGTEQAISELSERIQLPID
jgi:DNA-binding MurR/RpiR family transcriptional regulator